MADRFKMASVSRWLFLLFATLPSLQEQVTALPFVNIVPPLKCDKKSSSLNDCVKQGLGEVIRSFRSGNAELGVPPLDPMVVPFFNIRHDETNLTLDINMKNITITGFSDTILVGVKMNLNDVNKLEVTAKTSSLHIAGQYTSEGFIVTFPLHSDGSFSINMTDVTSSWVVYLREETRGQERYLQVDRCTMDMMPVTISFRPAEKLDDDNRLGEAVNLILNENSNEIYSVIKDKMAGVLTSMVTEFADQALSQVPESAFLQ